MAQIKRKSFIKGLAKSLGVSQVRANEFLNVLSNEIAKHLREDNDVKMNNFANFYVRDVKPKEYYSIDSGKKEVSKPKRTVKVKPSKLLKDAVIK